MYYLEQTRARSARRCNISYPLDRLFRYKFNRTACAELCGLQKWLYMHNKRACLRLFLNLVTGPAAEETLAIPWAMDCRPCSQLVWVHQSRSLYGPYLESSDSAPNAEHTVRLHLPTSTCTEVTLNKEPSGASCASNQGRVAQCSRQYSD